MYRTFYEDRFVRNLTRHSNLRQRIRRKVEQILAGLCDELKHNFSNTRPHLQ